MAVYVKGNRYYIDYYYNGKRKREVVGHIDKITRSIAEKALKARVGEIVQGKFNMEQTKKSLLFNKLCDEYIEWATTNHKCPSRDEQIVRVFLKFFSGKLLSQISSLDIERYKKERKDIGRKPETINRELTVLKRMFNLGIHWKVAYFNPVKGVKFLEVPKIQYHTLDDEEFESIYKHATTRLKPLLLCAYATGLRRGELLNLKWDDIDFKNNYIHVKETKNNESRSIPVDDLLKEKLSELKDGSKGEYVFQYFKDKTLTTFYREFWKAIKGAGVKCTFHSLRHTFASNLVTRLKEDMVTVMELTGHKDIRMLKRYSHTKEELKKEAILKLGNHIKTLTLDTPSVTNLGDITSTKLAAVS